jgi:hypothetical protein
MLNYRKDGYISELWHSMVFSIVAVCKTRLLLTFWIPHYSTSIVSLVVAVKSIAIHSFVVEPNDTIISSMRLELRTGGYSVMLTDMPKWLNVQCK